MATLPIQSADTGAPAADDTQGAEAQPDQGFLVCIWCKPDGSFSVGTEDAAEEMGEAGGEGKELDSYTPAKTAKEALTLALGLIKSGGQDDGQDAMGKQMQSAGFEAGYNED
jgi:hypothetical protein